MYETKHIIERKIKPQTQRLIGKTLLQQYGNFTDTYNKGLTLFRNRIVSSISVVNVYSKEVSTEPTYRECETILRLVNSDNKWLSRLLASLTSVCIEMNLIREEAEELYKEFVYYEAFMDIQAQDMQKEASFNLVLKTFANLQKVLSIVYQAQQVIRLLLSQLYSVVGKGFHPPNSGSNFEECMDNLGNLLVCLLNLDNLVGTPIVMEHCSYYLMVIQNMLHDPGKVSSSFESLKFLESNIHEIQDNIFRENIFKKIIQACSTDNMCYHGVSVEFAAYILHLLSKLDHDEDNMYFTQMWLQANTLFVFHSYIFGDLDGKLLKKLCELNKKRGFCLIAGTKLWCPDEFLASHIPSFFKYNLSSIKINQMYTKSQMYTVECNSLCSQASLSMMNIDKIRKKYERNFNIEVKNIQEATDSYLEALKLAKKISELVNWILRFHINQSLPITKSTMLALCRLIEVLKAFQLNFETTFFSHIDIITVISQHLTYKILSMIVAMRKNLTQQKSYKNQQLDVLSALSVCEQAIKGPNTKERLVIAKLAISSSGLLMEVCQEIKFMISRLSLFNSYHTTFLKMCNCSFLYENSDSLMQIYFWSTVESITGASKHHLFISGLNDCTNANEDMVTKLEVSMKDYFLNPIIQNIETKLRLQTHLHLDLTPCNPFSDYTSLKFFEATPSKLKGLYWSSKNEMEHYLSTSFYNLITVVLHDWHTYGEMRKLAQIQYTLNTVEDCLPMQTIEQGVDALEIMRNINVFVISYLYNLNSQVFVEGKSNNKHLNTINISHITNSIRTHGFGIMNTTVNFTYQFLQKKFFTFSQFMFDEQIKSRLLKDMKYFSEHKVELNQMYPYERAERFNKEIKKLGLNDCGQSYLDLFRTLISHIGNAVGYVRLIRSGGRRCLSEATGFVPDFNLTENISDYLLNARLPDLTRKAATLFTNELTVLRDNFEEATEYFKLLVDVFTPIFTNSKHLHLQNFFIIVPPLTVNFIEYSITNKERLTKKNKNDSTFTDDGFALGLAFIIELLKQEEQLNSLHWFNFIKYKFMSEKKSIGQQRLNHKKADSKFLQTLALTERRITTYEKEFQLLYYTYKSARIFFQT